MSAAATNPALAELVGHRSSVMQTVVAHPRSIPASTFVIALMLFNDF
jgi:hypothetical protein